MKAGEIDKMSIRELRQLLKRHNQPEPKEWLDRPDEQKKLRERAKEKLVSHKATRIEHKPDVEPVAAEAGAEGWAASGKALVAGAASAVSDYFFSEDAERQRKEKMLEEKEAERARKAERRARLRVAQEARADPLRDLAPSQRKQLAQDEDAEPDAEELPEVD